jgi:hypothetical protein
MMMRTADYSTLAYSQVGGGWKVCVLCVLAVGDGASLGLVALHPNLLTKQGFRRYSGR